MTDGTAQTSEARALPDRQVCRAARRSRDARFDGRFFVAVLTTGIYCRPICPARLPAEANVRYYASAAAAQDAGYRPCMRCLPQASGRPEWTLGSDTVMRGLRLIEDGYLNEQSAARLATTLGIGQRQLHRLFTQELGASAKSLARMVRARLARELLAASRMNMTEVAYHAGYKSLSRFNDEMRRVYETTPGALRKRLRAATVEAPRLRLRLPVRQPYDFDWMFAYLERRALVGIETVSGGPGAWRFERVVPADGGPAVVSVQQDGDALAVHVPLDAEPVYQILNRVRRVFDLRADGAHIHDYLRGDDIVGATVRTRPGLRVPGAWDGFETAVRAVLGQQVSVQRGTALADAMVARYGGGAFPVPEALVDREVAELGMPGRRGRAISEIARQVVAGELGFGDSDDAQARYNQLVGLDGIGPWTANYIRMRVYKDPDAFPDNDWVVMKRLATTAARARRTAEAWRPWRAYALMYLWYQAGLAKQKEK